MTYKICYWDSDAQEQRERDSTPEEDAQRDADIAENVKVQNLAFNASIIAQLDAIDSKSIRALRTSDTTRIEALEAEAQALRVQLRTI